MCMLVEAHHMRNSAMDVVAQVQIRVHVGSSSKADHHMRNSAMDDSIGGS